MTNFDVVGGPFAGFIARVCFAGWGSYAGSLGGIGGKLLVLFSLGTLL